MSPRAAAIALLLTLTTPAAAQEATPLASPQRPRLALIGSGGVSGVFFPVAGALCEALNNQPGPWRCAVQPSAGSVANLKALKARRIDLAVVQADWQRRAVEGEGLFHADGPDGGLRALMSLHAETFTLFARADAGIASLADLKGKRIGLSPPATGQRALWDDLLEAAKLNMSDFPPTVEAPPGDEIADLCAGRVQAAAIVVTHPSIIAAEALNDPACPLNLVGIDADVLASLSRDNPSLDESVIPARLYRADLAPIASFGVHAILVARADAPPGLAAQMMQAVMGDLDAFKRQHQALSALTPQQMSEHGIVAPLHPAAAGWYADHGSLTPEAAPIADNGAPPEALTP